PKKRLRLRVTPRTTVRAQPGVEEMRSARQAQHQADGAIRDILGPVVGNIGYGDSAFPRGGPVHVVDANTAPDDELAELQAIYGCAAQAEEMINHETGGVLDPAEKLFFTLCTECDYLCQFAQDALLDGEVAREEIGDINASHDVERIPAQTPRQGN